MVATPVALSCTVMPYWPIATSGLMCDGNSCEPVQVVVPSPWSLRSYRLPSTSFHRCWIPMACAMSITLSGCAARPTA